MRHHDRNRVVSRHEFDALAVRAARVLLKFGIATPDWDEWVDLKNQLLKVHRDLDPDAKEYVGKACSAFDEAAREAI